MSTATDMFTPLTSPCAYFWSSAKRAVSLNLLLVDSITYYKVVQHEPPLFDFLASLMYNDKVMKSSIHPQDYRPVVFSDEQASFAFLTQSTAQTNETIKWEDGNEYPLVKVHISSASHPFFTGEKKVIDIEGRVDKFEARRKAAEAHRKAMAEKNKKATEPAKKATSKKAADKK